MTTDSRPLVRPVFAKVSLIAFAILIPFMADVVWNYVEGQRLRVRLEAITARGEPLTARDVLVRPLNHNERDAERLYRAGAALSSRLFDDVTNEQASRVTVAERDRTWPSDLIELVRVQTARYGDAYTLADRAAALPFRAFEPGTNYTLLVSGLGKLIRLCRWRAQIRALDGDAEGAGEAMYTAVQAARTQRGNFALGPLPLVDIDPAALSPALRTRLADALGSLDRDDAIKQYFVAGRGYLLDVYRQQGRGHLWATPMRTWTTHRLNGSLDAFVAVVAAAERPWPDRVQAVGDAAAMDRAGLQIYSRATRQRIATDIARRAKSIRCARLRFSAAPLHLIDPLTGRPLQMVDCRP